MNGERDIDALCLEFKQGWQANGGPSIEDYLARLAAGLRPAALQRLIAAEVDLRQAKGDHVDRSEYHARFPGRAAEVDAAFEILSRREQDASLDPTEFCHAPSTPAPPPGLSAAPAPVTEASSVPREFGPYRVQRRISRGGFGEVFLAEDTQRQRLVAVKVPRSDRFHSEAELAAFIEEARTTVRLEHPGVVPLLDVFRTTTEVAIVQPFMAGGDLGTLIKPGGLRPERAAELIATVAEVVAFAHRKGFIHRDLKPSNILLDDRGQPLVADLGLALHESVQRLHRGDRAGTRPYRSPEQVRGEAHRLDGRSDIWSLGVMLYELLSGRRPFEAKNAGELDEEILEREPWPLRMRDPGIPAELDRICQKCLSKRVFERYPSASDLAEDLRHWLASGGAATPPAKKVPVVPKGLRSYGEQDADAFLDLLPGPRDRTGLPESIRFWKTRIELTDADRTFAVGMIYGPSGCGKSSLVKAGLLPRLAAHVIPIYVEATAGDTVLRLRKGLRKVFPEVPPDVSLAELLGFLREGRWMSRGNKVLIVLDQFEQWLHAQGGGQDRQLVQAIRQCDGARVQCLLLVRDDFWSATSRFMQELEVRPVDGENLAFVDRFDLLHARHVLMLLGRAYGRLPQEPAVLSHEQEEFLSRAVTELTQDGRVVCVRLALFADMIRSTPWTTSNLRQVGGAGGLGVTFLEETFSSDTARAEYRFHQTTARAVLQALLPESGTDIKGGMRSYADLLQAASGSSRAPDFDEVVRLLDGELRLITPTDPEGRNTSDESSTSGSGTLSQKYYQLTHDYLVPALRQWLARKQKETPRGRAELRLAERAALWNAKPEGRHLPSTREYLQIVGLTPRATWTEPQQRMMARAGRAVGLWWSAVLLLVLALLAGAESIRQRVVDAQHRARADGLIRQLLLADIASVPEVVEMLGRYPKLCVPRLAAVADDPERSVGDRVRAMIALADRPGRRASGLIHYALSEDVQTLAIICRRLAPFAASLRDELWAAANRDTNDAAARLRAGTLLAVADPRGSGWEELAPAVVDALMAENTLDLDAWVELLRPVAAALTPSLTTHFATSSATSPGRVTAARVLARYADATLLAQLLLEADAPQFAMLFPAAAQHQAAVTDRIRAALEQIVTPTTEEDRLGIARLRRNIGVTLLRLAGPDQVEPLLKASPDPTARSLLILEMHEFGVPLSVLLEALQQWRDLAARQAVWLAIEPYRGGELSKTSEQELVKYLYCLLDEGPHQAERSAAEWLLRRWGYAESARELTVGRGRKDGLQHHLELGHDWAVTSEGHTMTVVRGPVTFAMGSPEDEPGREDRETLAETTIAYSFAVSVHEITMQQFQRSRPNADFAWDVADDLQCPANKIAIVDAMRYCRWLSEVEGLDEHEMCYRPEAEIQLGDAVLTPERLARTGYRLPTEAEWEYVCRAGSATRWFCGDCEEQLGQFVWFALSAGERLRPIGLLRPNPLGLFDISGNVGEWCHTSAPPVQGAVRGGGYDWPARRVRSAQRYFQSEVGYSYNGIRIARTLDAFW